MTLEIRPHRPEETDAFNHVPQIVFGNYTVPTRIPDPPVILPEWSLCAFEDGELATTYAAYPFTMRLNGTPARAAGVTCVGTLPWHRRKGHLRAITEFDFKRRYEEQLEPIAILLASIAGIYQRYGYAVVSREQRFRIDPRWINFVPSLPPANGRMREAKLDELPLLKDLYKRFAAPRNGYLHRAEIMWQSRVLGTVPAPDGQSQGASLIAIYEEAGVPLGYVCYQPKFMTTHDDEAGPGQRVFVRDLAWLTPGAYRAIWEHFRTFDLAVRVEMVAPVDDPALDVMLDPRELHATIGDHLLGRVIDVERALPLRPYSADGRLTFALEDALCPWNRDRWAIEVGREGAKVARTNEPPQLSMDISALAMLLFGTVTPTQAVRIGRAEAAHNAPLDLWDAIWRTEHAPHCPDGF